MELIIFLVLVSVGYFVGSHKEKVHYRSIMEREKALMYLPTTCSKHPVKALPENVESHMVVGSVVISIDHFKKLLAFLRSIFGGEIVAYETLVDRARREAILRLKESCRDADEIINLRLETSSISKGGPGQIGSVEVLAYATAIYHK